MRRESRLAAVGTLLAGQRLDQARALPASGSRSLPARPLRECCARLPDRPCPCRRAPDRAWCPTSLMVTGSNSDMRQVQVLSLLVCACNLLVGCSAPFIASPTSRSTRRLRWLASNTSVEKISSAARGCSTVSPVPSAVASRSRSKSMLSALMPRSFEVESTSTLSAFANVGEFGRGLEARGRVRHRRPAASARSARIRAPAPRS